MNEQYVVTVHTGYVESESFACLTFFLTVEEEWTPLDIAKSFNEAIQACTDDINNEIDKHNGYEFTQVKYENKTRWQVLDEMITTWTIDDSLHSWEILSERGWSFHPSDEKITKVVHLTNMDSFVESYGEKKVDPENSPFKNEDDFWNSYFTEYEIG